MAIKQAKRRGRPASFGKQEVVALLAYVPEKTRTQLRRVAKRNGDTLNYTLAQLIEAGYKAATRKS